ncbi:hypothetical protein BN7_1144 [Wickerhamomyces ciferrii]|uniref:DRBM domain-containing protein n=1 Tax=Wickerhamomyces ciferrii (strain ATCC 14091 / BCRC 22168 / CBS 111 / JCM 3599 / NBRC 0793 / NRRL Y-1031 F-60-10) TaxID=1206466 RepID=K0KKF5_WICCF|nr:uncharacterized protein BN7_1144 [Wickerhamomyces ciferrii]CCH41603.1 hypothetical protein BN7_1144 [Wickerhamomyces ciferrii]
MLRCIIRGAPQCSKTITRRPIVHDYHVIRRVNTDLRLQKFQSTSTTSAESEIISNVEEIQPETQHKRPQLPTLEELNDYQIYKILNQIPSKNLDENIETFALLGEAHLEKEIIKILYELDVDKDKLDKFNDKIKQILVYWIFPFDILVNLKKNYERVNNYGSQDNFEIQEDSFKIDDSNKVLKAYFGMLYLAQKENKDIKTYDFLKSIIEPIIPRVIKIIDRQADDSNLQNVDKIPINNPTKTFSNSLNLEKPQLDLSKLLKKLWEDSLQKAENEFVFKNSIEALLNLLGGNKNLVTYKTRNTIDGYITECHIFGEFVGGGRDSDKDVSREKAAFRTITLASGKIYKSVWLPWMYRRIRGGWYKAELINFLKDIANFLEMKKDGKDITEVDIMALLNDFRNGKIKTNDLLKSNNISKLTKESISGNDTEKFDSSKIEDINLRRFFDFEWKDIMKNLSFESSEGKLYDMFNFTTVYFKTTKTGTKITSECFINDKLMSTASANTIDEAENKAGMSVFIESKEKIFHDIWFPMSKKELKMSKTGFGHTDFSKKYQKFLRLFDIDEEVVVTDILNSISNDSSQKTSLSQKNSDLKLDEYSNLRNFYKYELTIARSGLDKTNAKTKLNDLFRFGGEKISIKYLVSVEQKEKDVLEMKCFINDHLLGFGFDPNEKIAEQRAALNTLLQNKDILFKKVWLPMARKLLYTPMNDKEKASSFVKQYHGFLKNSQSILIEKRMNYKKENHSSDEKKSKWKR